MADTVQQFLGDGDGPATVGQRPETRGPVLVMARQVAANWRVSREGDLVVFQIGNSGPIRVRWADAAKIGHAMLTKAVEAKVQAGDMGRPVELRG